MTKEQLFESLNSIDDDIILRSEKSAIKHKPGRTVLKFCAAAACLGLIITSAFTISRTKTDIPTPSIPTNTSIIDPTNYTPLTPTGPCNPSTIQTSGDYKIPLGWNAHYAEASLISADLMYIPGYFTEELDETELTEVLPNVTVNTADYSGYAGFDHSGKLISVHLNVKTDIPDTNVHVTISDSEPVTCYVLEAAPIRSLCGSTAYYMYINETDTGVTLYADTDRDGVYYHFTMDTKPENLNAAKYAFELILTRFSNNKKEIKVPDLSIITPESIPEYKNEVISLNNAISDPLFGAYMLPDVPNGWQTESIRRYIDQNDNYLSGLWTHGYNSLSWSVSYLDSVDTMRITDADDTVNYDLALYPIPRAESVPDELREIVDNPIFRIDELTLDVIYKRAYKIDDAGDSTDYRMHFSVLYGDIVVEISTKGISPEWLYEQLSGLTK